jgi:putative hydrolase of the HAD superfamily
MKIKNIIFDVGNVLVSFDPERFMDNLGFDEKTKRAVDAAMFSNALWQQLDGGTYPKDAYLDKFIAEAPDYEKEIRYAYSRLGETITLRPYAVEWVSELKNQGYHLYILSNYGEYMLEQTREKMLFLPYMEGAVFSCECKLLKPKPEIYRHLLDTYHLDASESVFIDDLQANVEGAMDCGIPAIRFSDYETTKRLLSEMM